ncbi:unnamed protein product [Arctia plantaginis]|uniref:Uncharacterized protein n=1 Tax=Arctia plantaginis TaxID=874455 RepID=A0A8S0YYQ6_ARCPL|nr:unnamed protein product [Arctia plantaginis]CAB3229898.1 unnamed protein product [Arctia plantaginis]
MTSDRDENVSKATKEQQARAKLRESFLRAINELNGNPCNILTYEKTSLNATFAGWNPDGSEVFVRSLTTPSHVIMSSALLRTPDILAIQFDGSVL